MIVKNETRNYFFHEYWRIITFNLFHMPPCWDVGTMGFTPVNHTLAALTILQAFIRPNPCLGLWYKSGPVPLLHSIQSYLGRVNNPQRFHQAESLFVTVIQACPIPLLHSIQSYLGRVNNPPRFHQAESVFCDCDTSPPRSSVTLNTIVPWPR